MRYWLNSLLCVVVVQFSSFAIADSSKPLLRIGVPEDFPPFYFHDENGELRGASYEVVVSILHSLGYQTQATQYPNMRQLLANIAAGKEDIVVNLTGTESRRKVAYFTDTPHIYESQDVIVRADSAIRFEGKLPQLSPYKIGTIFGWTYGPEFDSANYLHKEYVNDSEEQLKGLLSGNFDMLINNKNFVQSVTQTLGVSKAFEALDHAIFILPVTIAVSKAHPNATSLVATLENEVVRYRKTEEYQSILTRYGFDPNILNEGGSL
ncbi:hypothetical protein TW81_16000 [Vibrio galatheae]|uniref:Solute-binding protein family 3/N-terminal domain-containing protein n=1 Tax=Vibrio galatheae TaxID=579748 RepID=A0A0F4NFX3_9VIBR|nr:transporter substrate-binding domain-containing protein [Vibrio galatheae]KJY81854.1 hypothetical protein TW81_16000 [Vibrio galatheae]